MTYCSQCGAQNKDGASFCTNCGTAIKKAPVHQPQQPYYQPYQQPYQQPNQQFYAQPQQQPAFYAPDQKSVSKGRRIASMILAVFSFICAIAALFTCLLPVFSLIFAFAGLTQGIISCALCKRGLAIAGIIISSISIIIAVVVLIVYTVSGSGNAIFNGIRSFKI